MAKDVGRREEFCDRMRNIGFLGDMKDSVCSSSLFDSTVRGVLASTGC